MTAASDSPRSSPCTSYTTTSNRTTADTVTSDTTSHTVGIHVFYNTTNLIRELHHKGDSWVEGHFHAECIPGTQIACISWLDKAHPGARLYFQAGHEVSAISEYVWTKGIWSAGRLALPPA
ncbi:hypothetical protein N7457_004112 [Penicillium paradoxum]|uniref:uncharacterized protein n=1 Tax=Penicillium paradoxum TaxID=176176 RepID=UPI002547D8BC|nr:uncharacterized protein N7457_004112 [Penicillium paradoxum]KAJ5782338.1 hypothetical protein N7457_004112 [Penicillium paradoxum]